MKKVSILGCGWVGQALRVQLAYNCSVVCLSRDIEANSKAHMYACDVLVIAIPPRGNYLDVLTQTLGLIKPSTQVILLSSISFYDDKVLVVEAEALVEKYHTDVVILRLGGLMGYDRIAGKYTAGKTLPSDARTNYVHRDDVLGSIESIIMKEIKNEIFDVLAPVQTMKKKIFSQNAKTFTFRETKFLQGDITGKDLNPKKLCAVLGYTFVKEDVLEFWS